MLNRQSIVAVIEKHYRKQTLTHQIEFYEDITSLQLEIKFDTNTNQTSSTHRVKHHTRGNMNTDDEREGENATGNDTGDRTGTDEVNEETNMNQHN